MGYSGKDPLVSIRTWLARLRRRATWGLAILLASGLAVALHSMHVWRIESMFIRLVLAAVFMLGAVVATYSLARLAILRSELRELEAMKAGDKLPRTE